MPVEREEDIEVRIAKREQTAIEEMTLMLMRAGWKEKEAREEAIRALDDAAQEDGYDGP